MTTLLEESPSAVVFADLVTYVRFEMIIEAVRVCSRRRLRPALSRHTAWRSACLLCIAHPLEMHASKYLLICVVSMMTNRIKHLRRVHNKNIARGRSIHISISVTKC